MSRALPNLQEIYFHKAVMNDLFFEDGENSAPDAATAVRRRASGLPTRRIDIIASTFPKLRRLGLMGIHLNGSYPRLLDFPRLQNLLLLDVEGLELDLETIARSLPELKDLILGRLPLLRGSIASLGVLKERLRSVCFNSCPGITGNLNDLADFPFLEDIWMQNVDGITGDVRQIDDKEDFPALRQLELPRSVYGATARPFERVADAPELMNAICRLKKRSGARIDGDNLWYLSGESPDYYPPISDILPTLKVQIVVVDECVGWRWTDAYGYRGCKTNWVGGEPDGDSSECKEYRRDEERSPFRDLVDPPTEPEYQRIARPEARVFGSGDELRHPLVQGYQKASPLFTQ